MGRHAVAGAAGLYGEAPAPLDRSIYPTIGAGLQFVIKPMERMNVNLSTPRASKTTAASI